MEYELGDPPSPISEIMAWLRGEGFESSEQLSSGPANHLVVLEHDGARVRVLSDRGEWSLGLSFVGFDDWYHSDVLEAYLDDFPLAGDLSDLAHQVEFIQQRLSEASERLAADPGAEKTLQVVGEEYMRRRLGIPPPAQS